MLLRLLDAGGCFEGAFFIGAVLRTVHHSSIYLLMRLVLVLTKQVRLVASIERGATLPPVFHLNEVFDDWESIEVTAEPWTGAISLSAHR